MHATKAGENDARTRAELPCMTWPLLRRMSVPPVVRRLSANARTAGDAEAGLTPQGRAPSLVDLGLMSSDGGLPPMQPRPRGRSTRDRPAKPPLSVEAVVDAALAILRSGGLEAVTMRQVATALDTGPSTLYVYVHGRESLHQAMLDRVIAGVELDPPDPARWRAQLHALLDRMHAALTAHPGIAAMTLVDPPTTLAVLDLVENLMGILLAGGIDSQDVAWACDIFVLLTTAAAREDDVRHGQDRRQQADQVYKTFAGLPPGRFPLIVAHAEQMVAGDGRERFRFAINIALDGNGRQGAPRPLSQRTDPGRPATVSQRDGRATIGHPRLAAMGAWLPHPPNGVAAGLADCAAPRHAGSPRSGWRRVDLADGPQSCSMSALMPTSSAGEAPRTRRPPRRLPRFG
jgi:AcrR family transcriptional regulator